jgi:hypothetical protein
MGGVIGTTRREGGLHGGALLSVTRRRWSVPNTSPCRKRRSRRSPPCADVDLVASRPIPRAKPELDRPLTAGDEGCRTDPLGCPEEQPGPVHYASVGRAGSPTDPRGAVLEDLAIAAYVDADAVAGWRQDVRVRP